MTAVGGLHGVDREKAQRVAQFPPLNGLRSHLSIHAAASLLCASLEIDQAQDHGREDELHREPHLTPRHHDVVRSAHPRVVQHGNQIREVDALGVGEADHHHGLIRAGYVPGDERVPGVHRRHPLEVDVGAAELRTDMVHVVGHAPQDGVDYRVLAVAAMMPVAMQLLDPLEIDDRHDADEQIDVACDIDAIADVSAMQAFVEEEVAVGRHRLPVGESARVTAEFLGLGRVMNVATHLAATGRAILGEGLGQLAQQIGFRPEMAHLRTAATVGSLHALAHLDAVVAVKGIALDYLRLDAFAPEDVREALHDGGGSRAGGSGHGDYRMLDAQTSASGRNSERSLKSGELNGRSAPLSYSAW